MHGNYSVLSVNMCVCVFWCFCVCVCVLVYIRFVNALVIYFIDSSPFLLIIRVFMGNLCIV